MAPLLLLLLQVAVPLGLIAWVAMGRSGDLAGWGSRTLLAACYMVAIRMAGLWLALPWFLPILFLVTLLPAAFFGLRRTGSRHHPAVGMVRWIPVALTAVAIPLLGNVIAGALAGNSPPDEMAVDLAFPLRSGTYLVANGGSRELVNAHLAPLSSGRDAEFAGMRGGLDLVRIDRLGRRADGFAPSDPNDYYIFGDPVLAPCAGRIVTAVDGFPDLSPPDTDRENMAGNHVIIECEGLWVLLAHLRSESVAVMPGNTVSRGDQIGEVGNSGNTSEPHLHIHVQRPGTPEQPISGEPLPITFAGRYLARNDRFTSLGAE